MFDLSDTGMPVGLRNTTTVRCFLMVRWLVGRVVASRDQLLAPRGLEHVLGAAPVFRGRFAGAGGPVVRLNAVDVSRHAPVKVRLPHYLHGHGDSTA